MIEQVPATLDRHDVVKDRDDKENNCDTGRMRLCSGNLLLSRTYLSRQVFCNVHGPDMHFCFGALSTEPDIGSGGVKRLLLLFDCQSDHCPHKYRAGLVDTT